MNNIKLIDEYLFVRQQLEQDALAKVCACQYYDLADEASGMSEEELIAIISQKYNCEMCGLRGGVR